MKMITNPFRKQSRQLVRKLTLLLLVFLAMLPAMAVQAQSGGQSQVFIIPIDGEITPAMASFLKDQIDVANEAGATGILIEIQTLGGRVDSAIQMRDAIIASKAPVAVYIESRAISAGALISIAAKSIVMSPGSHIGAAQPIPNDPKTLAFVSGEFRTTAERTGRDPKIAMAMVDESIEIEGVVRKGEILDMTANEAMRTGFANHLASGRSEALKALGWDKAALQEVRPDYRFRIIQFLTSAEVASILLTIGTLALIVEFFTPGFGVPGLIGIICFVLYFTSGYMAGYTDLWAILVFFAGIVLLIIEIIVPGFGIFGISGLIALFVGIVFAAPSVQQGVFSLLAAIGVSVIAIPIFTKIFGKSRFLRRLVLSHSEKTELGYVPTAGKSNLIGKTGVAVTVLRPAGTILIDGDRIDAIAQGEFISSGTPVAVVRVEGAKVVVSSTSAETNR